MNLDYKFLKRLFVSTFYLAFSLSYAQNETTLTLINSYDIGNIGEPSGLAYDAINNQLFTVSDSDDIFRISITGNILERYDFSADLEGVTTYSTPNTLLIAIEDTYELVEYNYITGNSVPHTMEYENQNDPGSGIEGVTYNPTNGEIYFLNEKDPAALIIANSNFNVINEHELTFAGDLSASSYVAETGFLWLGSDKESTLYKCDTSGNVIQTFPLQEDGDELDKIEGIAIDHQNELLYLVTDGDARLYVYSINRELATNCEEHIAFSIIQAEDYCNQSGVEIQNGPESSQIVSSIENNDWVMFSAIDLTNANSIEAQITSEQKESFIEVRLDAPDGILIGALTVPNTNGNQIWQTVQSNIENTVGKHDVYFVFKGNQEPLLNIDSFQFKTENILSIANNTESSNQFLLHPNPIIDEALILNAENYTIIIYNINGETVFTKAIANEREVINLSKLSSGIYYAKILKKTNTPSIKIIKK